MLVRPIAIDRGFTVSDEYLVKVIKMMQERAHSINDFIDFSKYFFTAPTEYDEKARAKNWTPEAKQRLTELLPQFKVTTEWTHDSIESVVRVYAEGKEISAGKLIHPLRLSVSGVGMGPGLFEMLQVIGKDEVISRVEKALTVL
jgi:glutamyl-tRNA synthetase